MNFNQIQCKSFTTNQLQRFWILLQNSERALCQPKDLFRSVMFPLPEGSSELHIVQHSDWRSFKGSRNQWNRQGGMDCYPRSEAQQRNTHHLVVAGWVEGKTGVLAKPNSLT